jgi:hypothetical protein
MIPQREVLKNEGLESTMTTSARLGTCGRGATPVRGGVLFHGVFRSGSHQDEQVENSAFAHEVGVNCIFRFMTRHQVYDGRDDVGVFAVAYVYPRFPQRCARTHQLCFYHYNKKC